MLSKDKRQELQDKHDSYLLEYHGSREAGNFRALLSQHRCYIAAKKHLLLDDISIVLHNIALDNDQAMEKIVDIVKEYIAVLEEKP